MAHCEDANSRALIAEYRPLLVYARRLTGNGSEAGDLVHAAMVRALWNEASSSSEAPQNVGAWLRAVLFRLFVDEQRRISKERNVDVSILDKIEGTESIEEPPPSWSSVSIEDVRTALPLLPRRFREPYDLFAFQQLSYLDIAGRLGLSVKTVGTRITRARSKLRVLLRSTYARP